MYDFYWSKGNLHNLTEAAKMQMVIGSKSLHDLGSGGKQQREPQHGQPNSLEWMKTLFIRIEASQLAN